MKKETKNEHRRTTNEPQSAPIDYSEKHTNPTIPPQKLPTTKLKISSTERSQRTTAIFSDSIFIPPTFKVIRHAARVQQNLSIIQRRDKNFVILLSINHNIPVLSETTQIPSELEDLKDYFFQVRETPINLHLKLRITQVRWLHGIHPFYCNRDNLAAMINKKYKHNLIVGMKNTEKTIFGNIYIYIYISKSTCILKR